MTEAQGWHLIGMGWLAIAIIDKPVDLGSLVYVAACIASFIAAFRTEGKP